MDELIKWSALISNVFTILASGIAVYLFIFKRKALTTVFDLLVNYTYQLSLSEVKEKLERLNEYNAKDPDQCEKIVNILNEIIGQIRGNSSLKIHFKDLLLTIEELVSDSMVLPRFNGYLIKSNNTLGGKRCTNAGNTVKNINRKPSSWLGNLIFH